ncbi:P-loop containing nucleoside triphosphate hydrolase [Pseudocohnilembus persalinus]|uniref:p-loop containing nucleoside triphosphate hydrolase n=1 Tax=Pseudocohnilembus persalinus TaxID=266149 RepID=A0A0V0R3Z4_PSEPJ|nr:P-loop containing nucleoside triphosphate hydrolase [Pseudocohnilembus persalinus]|eukprot:KRX09072.1 P-loop containing nucleoside triphosphate hydrolase [Pseudocohnilembus persalinus]
MENSNANYISLQEEKNTNQDKNSLIEENNILTKTSSSKSINFNTKDTDKNYLYNNENLSDQDKNDSDIRLKINDKDYNNKKNDVKKENEDPKKPKRAKKPMQALKRLLSYTLRYRNLLICGLIGLAISSAYSVLIPYLASKMIDIISGTQDLSKLGNQTVVFLLVKVMYVVRNELFNKIVKKDVQFFDVNKSGELMSRITSDTSLLQSAASDNISMFLRQIVQLLGSTVFLFVLSYKLTLYMFAIVPVVAIIVLIFIKFYKKFTVQYQSSLSKANGYATEAIGNIRVVKSFGTEEKEISIFDKQLFQTYIIGSKRAMLYGVFAGTISVVAFSAIILVLYLGGRMVINGDLSVGDLSGFVLYTITMAMSLIGTGGVLNTLVTALGVAEKLFEIMDHPIKIQPGTVIPKDVKGEIKFEQVVFKYPTKDDVEVLKTIDFEIKGGQNVALVGSSGSGKSSIISLIERFYDIQQGSIKLDGVDIRDLDTQWLHKTIGFVSQEPTLFSGTLRDNITYGVDQATDEQIEESIKMANAYDFIHDKQLFPEGLSTIVGERGVKLSGGQKQRIAIARALIKNPAILIFDEATSALDAESEYQVQYAIDQLVQRGEKTIIIIAHRLSTIINCENIIVIDKGIIKEQGSHQNLLKQNNFYAKLIQRQLQNFQGDDKNDVDNLLKEQENTNDKKNN